MDARGAWAGGLALIAGCALSHHRPVERDAPTPRDTPDAMDAADVTDAPGAPDTFDVPDAPPVVMRCSTLDAPARPPPCDVASECWPERDNRVPRDWNVQALFVDAADRPVIATSAWGDVGALAIREGDDPWVFENLPPSTGFEISPGRDEAGQPCAHLLLDDGAGTLRLIEHVRGEAGELEDVELRRFAGTLTSYAWPRAIARGLVRVGDALIALYLREETPHVGVRTAEGWRDVALPGVMSAQIAEGDGGAWIAMIDDRGTSVAWLTTESIATGAIDPGDTLLPPTDAPEPGALMLAGGSRPAILADDGVGRVVLLRRQGDGTWRSDVLGEPSLPECGPPIDGATCAIDEVRHHAITLAASSDGSVLGIFVQAEHHREFVGLLPEPSSVWPWEDAGPPPTELVWSPTLWSVTPQTRVVQASPDDAPRVTPLDVSLEVARLALGPGNVIHLLAYDVDDGRRYLRLAPR